MSDFGRQVQRSAPPTLPHPDATLSPAGQSIIDHFGTHAHHAVDLALSITNRGVLAAEQLPRHVLPRRLPSRAIALP